MAVSKLAELDIDGTPALASLHKLSEGIEHMEEKVKAFGAAFAGFGIAFEAVMKLAEGFESVMSMSERMDQLHHSTGESVHDLTILTHALDLVGAGSDAAEGFIFKLDQALSGVNEEGRNTAEAFKALGLSQKELVGKGALEQVETLSKAFAGVKNQADKAAIAANLFGKRQGAEALRLIADPEALETAKKQAEPLASLLDRNTVSFEALGHAIKGVELQIPTFFGGVLEEVAPGITDIAQAMEKIDWAAMGRGAGSLLEVIVDMATHLASLAENFEDVEKEFAAARQDKPKADGTPGEIHRAGPLHVSKDALGAAESGAVAGALAGSILPGVGTIFGAFAGGLLGLAAGKIWGKDDAPKIDDSKAAKPKDEQQEWNWKEAPVGALQRIGLGGGFDMGGDPALNEAQRHTQLLQTIAENTRPRAGGSSGSATIPGVDAWPAV